MFRGRGALIAHALVALSGCGFTATESGRDAGPLATCSSTALRGFEPLGGAGMIAARGGIAPAGASMAAVWENPTGMMGNGAGSIFLALVDNLGRVGPAAQIASGQDPVLVRADRLSLFWRQGTAIMFEPIADDGTPGAQVTVYDGAADYFDVAWSGSEFAIAVNGAGADQYEVNWLSADANGALVSGPTKIPDGGNNSLLPAIAWAGSYYAVAWTDTRPGTPGIFYARFDHMGQRLGPDQQLPPAGLRGAFPSVAAQESGGVVACYQVRVTATNDEVYCSRLDDSGNITAQPQLSKTALGSQDPNVVSHGHTTWVIWDEANSAGQQDLNWQFLDDSGMPVLAQPYATNSPGSRPHGAVGPDALYLTQYDLLDNGTTNAEVFTINCY